MASARKPGALDRVLGVFAEVKPGEGLGAILLTIAIFIILSAYYVLKTAREGLILAGGAHLPGIGEIAGDQLKIAATGAMAILLLAIVPAYGRLASRVPRKRLLDISYALVVTSLVVFFVLGRAGVPVGLPFFIWLGIVSVFLIAQFWSFANDLYTQEQGKRLFAIIAIGGTAGAIVGPKLTKITDTYGMMAIAGGMLLATLFILGLVDRIAHRDRHAAIVPADEPIAKTGGFELVMRDRYLLLIGVMLILLNLINTTGEYILSNAAKHHAELVVPAAASAAELEKARGAVIEGLYADFFFWVNLLGFLIQALLASRIIKYAGLRTALFVLPAMALAGYGAIGLVGGLAVIKLAKIGENSIDYSLQNTVRQALFLPTSREVKYKAKAALDMFFVRFGDTAAALFVLLGIHVLGLTPRGFAIANVCFAAVWIVVTIGIARHHRRLEARTA